MKRLLRIAAVLLLAAAGPALAAPTFPALTGHVVDDANILSPASHAQLEQSLADYERGTGNQVVVATLRSLQGYSIEDYGVALGRKWAIGQKDKDNGALLIVAPNDKKVRLEVGYGLEGLLTDARSSEIVHDIIVPHFRAGNMEQGVVDGTQAVLATLGGKSAPAASQPQNQRVSPFQVLFFIVLFFAVLMFARRHPVLAAALLSGAPTRYGSSGIGGGWSSGRSSGGFSGRGGSFGGGGASGGW